MSTVGIQIRLRNNNLTYWAGEQVEGAVEVSFYQPTSIDFISLDFEGYTRCVWITNSLSGRHKLGYNLKMSGFREHFNKRTVLAEVHNDYYGFFRYNFMYTLPSKLPGSMESDLGVIVYKLTATVKPIFKEARTTQKILKIRARVDLNQVKDLARKPFFLETEGNLALFCISFGKISLSVSGHSSGMIIGELVPLLITIKNDSSAAVRSACINLVKYEIYTTTLPSTYYKYVKSTFKFMTYKLKIKPHQSKTFQTYFHVPKTYPSTIDPNALIQVKYFIEVSCKVAGLGLKLTERQSVIIGTKALVEIDSAATAATAAIAATVTTVATLSTDELKKLKQLH